MAAVSEDPDIDTSDGITFLGNGLIKLSPKFLGYKYSHALDFVVFGVLKSSGDGDPPDTMKPEDDDSVLSDPETFKELWRAVHMPNCDPHVSVEKFGLDERGRKSPVYQPALYDDPPWDEAAVDSWVNYLYEES